MSYVCDMTRDEFEHDSKTQDAVLYRLGVIGEAAKFVSTELQASQPLVPWRTMAGMRDRLFHGYRQVNLSIVWETVTEILPALLPQLDGLP